MIANCLGINEAGHLEISGCDTVRLAEQYGTPLYVMSEDEIRSVCRRYVASFAKNYNGNGKPIYASKAVSCKEIYRIVLSEGLDVEVVSGGELYTALQAGVPGSQIHIQCQGHGARGCKGIALSHRLSDFGEGAFCPRGGGDAPVLRQGAGRAGHGL